jgi:hypothetical protein
MNEYNPEFYFTENEEEKQDVKINDSFITGREPNSFVTIQEADSFMTMR